VLDFYEREVENANGGKAYLLRKEPGSTLRCLRLPPLHSEILAEGGLGP
jgi:hypothetical protein